MKNIIILLLILNAIAHVFSYIKLNKQKDPGATGVLAFVFINAIVAALFYIGYDWSKWLVLAFPAIGGLGLFITSLMKGKGTLIDYIIFALDVALVALILRYYIL